jgi:hypothetical protein
MPRSYEVRGSPVQRLDAGQDDVTVLIGEAPKVVAEIRRAEADQLCPHGTEAALRGEP